jgi:hypothetical protein
MSKKKHILLVNTSCLHLHSFCATGMSKGLARRVTLSWVSWGTYYHMGYCIGSNMATYWPQWRVSLLTLISSCFLGFNFYVNTCLNSSSKWFQAMTQLVSVTIFSNSPFDPDFCYTKSPPNSTVNGSKFNIKKNFKDIYGLFSEQQCP